MKQSIGVLIIKEYREGINEGSPISKLIDINESVSTLN
jgi:hypothetical protein